MTIDAETVVSLSSEAHHSPSLTICADDGRTIVHITRKGQVIVNPDFTTDEAARAFWKAVQDLAGREQ